MKVNLKKIIVLFLGVVCVLSTVSPTFAMDKSDSELFYDDCYNDIDNILIIDSKENNVTNTEKNNFKKIYETGSYDNIRNYLFNNSLSISLTSNPRTRAFEGKTFRKVVTCTQTKTFKLSNKVKKDITIYYDLIIKCSYTVNTKTEAIGTVKKPTISIKQFNQSKSDAENLKLHPVKTDAKVTNGGYYIFLDISFYITAKQSSGFRDSLTFNVYPYNYTIK